MQPKANLFYAVWLSFCSTEVFIWVYIKFSNRDHCSRLFNVLWGYKYLTNRNFKTSLLFLYFGVKWKRFWLERANCEQKIELTGDSSCTFCSALLCYIMWISQLCYELKYNYAVPGMSERSNFTISFSFLQQVINEDYKRRCTHLISLLENDKRHAQQFHISLIHKFYLNFPKTKWLHEMYSSFICHCYLQKMNN